MKKNKRVKFYLLDKDQGIYFSKDRILKIDTICIRINNNNKINIYGFKNEIEEFRFGENKGTYQCNLCYNENDIKNIFTRTDTIYVN
ncbi:hypothetical protein [Flavobacterium oreochromis]|uniref:Uncharacterized protein n=1 Tax=Flavobacterium columnare TaxID=996 RepID=A0A246G9F3_9FLAO|nr:hypothetical protein [Flavobacterium oreochromis]OWP74363.1 hypothetical protein BWK62_14540 [Flavobacterium oreochromis]